MSGAAITLAVDFYYSFRSPYSYLAVARMVRLAADHDVEVRLRAVYPLAIRRPELVERNIRLGRGDGGVGADVAFSPYIVRDAPRLAEFHGIPFAWPRPDPIVMQRDPFRVAAEQPNIRRVTRLAIEAEHAFAAIEEAVAEVSAAALDAHCRDRLANYKVPKLFAVRDSLPMLPIGKIDKPALKAEALADSGAGADGE